MRNLYYYKGSKDVLEFILKLEAQVRMISCAIRPNDKVATPTTEFTRLGGL